ncbi:hypothetical protein SAMD00019534_005170 [Acytostelium subglobosum LB1]|uniref:hypothetical protein n=1 Tax=Acytostelium subglobosum LB1 TaxID=1410327 RepID=UPI000644D94D|nr:hypothetical protein SAMD00019534_005170 [Acytostelium subglobosum LB1]GAM17342.1 hypothetical protein SAMD00019534_005170 [Acytostelium subglobosum LB1]|eukprot:XP_012759404.1 hypothetical protein SAMD00019534_005170 [Acytostelium subglobosum LB1]
MRVDVANQLQTPQPTKEKARRNFPEQIPMNAKEQWVARLAGNEPLQKMTVGVPHGFKGDGLMKMLMENEIPLIRATWYIKIIYGNMPKNKNQVCPSTDWTKLIVQFFFGSVRNLENDQSRDPYVDRLRKMLYLERLIKWSFYECLLNKETLLTLLIDQLDQDTAIVPGLLLFYSNTMMQSTSMSQRFLFKCHDKLTKLTVQMNRAQTPSTGASLAPPLPSFAKEQKIFSILCTIAKQISITLPDVFLSFKYHKELVSFIWPTINTLEKLEQLNQPQPFTLKLTNTPEYTFLKRYLLESSQANDSSNSSSVGGSDVSQPQSSTNRKFLEISDLIDAFDRFISHNDLAKLYSEVFGTSNKTSLDEDKQKILLVCEWAVTSCRSSPFLHVVAASLLRRYASAGGGGGSGGGGGGGGGVTSNYPLQSILVQFLDTHQPSGSELRSICNLFSELTRNQVFSQNSYARYLISRGTLEQVDGDAGLINNEASSSSAAALIIANNHKLYLREFPIFNSNDIPTNQTQQQRNQRRTILASKFTDNVEQMESVRDLIKQYLHDHNDVIKHHNVISKLRSLSFYYLTSLTEWLSLCIRIQFQQTQDMIKTASSSSSINSVLKGFHRLELPLTEHYISRCFMLMESIKSYNTIAMCLLTLWSNFDQLETLHRFIIATTCRLELVFLYSSDKMTQLLDLLHTTSTSTTTTTTNEQPIKRAYLLHLLTKYQSIGSVHQWTSIVYNNINNNNNNDDTQPRQTLSLERAQLTSDESMLDKSVLQGHCRSLLNDFMQQQVASREHGASSSVDDNIHMSTIQMLRTFDTNIIQPMEQSFTQQDIASEFINAILGQLDQPLPMPINRINPYATFLSCLSIGYPVDFNHPELFCRLFKTHLTTWVQSANQSSQLATLFDPMSSLLISLVVMQYIDANTLLSVAILPAISTFLPHDLNQQDQQQQQQYDPQQLGFIIKMIQVLLCYNNSSNAVIEFLPVLSVMAPDKTQALAQLFPTLCKLYDYFEKSTNSSGSGSGTTNGHGHTGNVDIHTQLLNDIKLILTDADYKHVFLVDSQRHIESMKTMNLDPVTSRYLFNLIIGNIKMTDTTTTTATTSSFDNNSVQPTFERLRPENVINYAYQVINNTLSNSFNCYWYIHLSYMELRLLLDEWQSLPPMQTTPPIRSPSQSPQLGNAMQTSSSSQTSPANTPESILTQFILCHFEQNKGWEKIFLYEKLFIYLPQTVRNELVKLTTIIMESQYEESSFIAPESKLYLFSHILSNLPVRKRPSQKERTNNKKDELLLQKSFTELIINILSSYEPSSPLLQGFAVSLLRQLNQFLNNTRLYDAVNLPAELVELVLNSLSMRISFLIPLCNTIKLAKTECKIEELSIALLSLLSRSIIQSDEEYDFFNVILTILDLLLSDNNNHCHPIPNP